MLFLVPLLAVTSVLLFCVYWIADIWVIGDHVLVISSGPALPERRLVGLFAGLPGLAAWLVAMFYLSRMFRAFAQGVVVDARIVTYLRLFSLFVAVSAVCEVVSSGARRWARGEFDGPIWTHIQIASEQQAILFSALVFYLVSHALAAGEAYREEAESYL